MTIDDDLKDVVRPFDHPEARGGDVTIFHFALPSPMTPQFASLPRGRVLQYHNITPAHFFARYDQSLFRLARLGRQDLATLVGRVDLALGDSEYNRVGARADGVRADGRHADRDRHGSHHRARRAARRSRRSSTTASTTSCSSGASSRTRRSRTTSGWPSSTSGTSTSTTGSSSSAATTASRATMRRSARCIGRVRHPPGPLHLHRAGAGRGPGDLLRMARVYVSLSEHEGFCVPLLEAMAADVPVLAYARGGGAGHARAARACSSRRRTWSTPPNCSAS